MTPYQISRWRQVFHAMVAMTEPMLQAEPRLAGAGKRAGPAADRPIVVRCSGPSTDRERTSVLAMPARRVIEHAVNQQRKILHQSEHSRLLLSPMGSRFQSALVAGNPCVG